jgi:hypothetical protein
MAGVDQDYGIHSAASRWVLVFRERDADFRHGFA